MMIDEATTDDDDEIDEATTDHDDEATTDHSCMPDYGPLLHLISRHTYPANLMHPRHKQVGILM
jgi:hypothetical protein